MLGDLCKSEAKWMQILCKYTCGSPDCFFQWEECPWQASCLGHWEQDEQGPSPHPCAPFPPTRPIISICDHGCSQCFCQECVGLGFPITLSLGVGWLVSPLSDWGVLEGTWWQECWGQLISSMAKFWEDEYGKMSFSMTVLALPG